MAEIVSKSIEIISPKMPPDIDFVEDKIRQANIEPLRWAIVEAKDNKLTLNVSGYKLI